MGLNTFSVQLVSDALPDRRAGRLPVCPPCKGWELLGETKAISAMLQGNILDQIRGVPGILRGKVLRRITSPCGHSNGLDELGLVQPTSNQLRHLQRYLHG